VRILVANTYVPLRPDERETAAAALATALSALGHEAERVRIPFAEDPDTVLEQILGLRLTDIALDGDLLIAVGPRAHLLRHRRKVLWLGPEDAGDRAAWSADAAWRANAAGGERPHAAALRRADRIALTEAERICAALRRECEEIWRFSGVAAQLVDEGRDSASTDWERVARALIR
jgi:hypothetical protein